MKEEGTSAANFFHGGDIGLGFEFAGVSLIRRLLLGGSLPSSAALPSSPFRRGIGVVGISSESGMTSKLREMLVTST